MAENNLKDRWKGYSDKAESAINSKVKGTKLSWGMLIIAGGIVWALIEIFKFITMFF